MRGYSLLLKPLSWLYAFFIWIRHKAYDRGFFYKQSFQQPIIKIGNLSFGGTGKTPLAIYLAEYYSSILPVCILSRGYARRSKGFLEVLTDSHVSEVGDEPLLIKNRVTKSHVFVSESRLVGIENINHVIKKKHLIILDDALQHRALDNGFSILLTDFHRPFFKDFLVPAGSLRDLKRRASAADLIIVTKSPKEISHEERESLLYGIQKYTSKPIIFSGIQYLPSLNSFTKKETQFQSKVACITAIANPNLFLKYIETQAKLIKHFNFSDHFNFTENHIRNILSDSIFLSEGIGQIAVTEKDAMKLAHYEYLFKQYNIDLLVVPISICFDENDARLLHSLIAKNVLNV